jgi:uncharacterized membrane protein YkoI
MKSIVEFAASLGCDHIRLGMSASCQLGYAKAPPMAAIVRLFVLLLVVANLGRPAYAGEYEPDHDADDHDRARGLVEHGDILPLPAIIDAVSKAVPGDIVAISLKQLGKHWFYDLIIVTPAGQRMSVTVDAGNLAILGEGGDH